MAALNIKQGADFAVGYRCLSNGATVDLTGASVASQFRTDFDAKSAVFTLTSDNGGIDITNAVEGIVVLVIPRAMSSAVNFKGESLEGVFDIEITFSDGSRSNLETPYGTWTLYRELTRV